MEAEKQTQAAVTARAEIVGEAIKSWVNQLVDLGGRNNLLYFRDLKVGTLDLTRLLGDRLGGELLGGRKLRLSEIFANPDDLKNAARRARALRSKAIENDEERGLRTLHIGFGFSTWSSD